MDRQQTIVAARRTYSDVGDNHYHPFAQLILSLMGTLYIETPVHRMDLDESSVFIIPPECEHYFFARDTNEFLTLDIPAPIVGELAHGEAVHSIRTDFDDRYGVGYLAAIACAFILISYSVLSRRYGTIPTSGQPPGIRQVG